MAGLSLTKSMAQPIEEKTAVMEVITRLFKGMEMGDSAMVASTFANDVTFATIIRDAENIQRIERENSGKDFLRAVGTPHKKTWYEEIWDATIQIDGDFAQVWCNYAFYLDNAFSHCGVDAFQLFREPVGWKIFQLVDTRRKNRCVVPSSIQDKHK